MKNRTYFPSMDAGINHWKSLTEGDKAIARDQLKDAGAIRAYLPPNGDGYVGFENAAGETVGYLHPTYIGITSRAARMPEANTETGRQGVPGSESGTAWDTFLSGWTPPPPPIGPDRRRITKRRPTRGMLPPQNKCDEPGCGIYIPQADAQCRKHRVAVNW